MSPPGIDSRAIYFFFPPVLKRTCTCLCVLSITFKAITGRTASLWIFFTAAKVSRRFSRLAIRSTQKPFILFCSRDKKKTHSITVPVEVFPRVFVRKNYIATPRPGPCSKLDGRTSSFDGVVKDLDSRKTDAQIWGDRVSHSLLFLFFPQFVACPFYFESMERTERFVLLKICSCFSISIAFQNKICFWLVFVMILKVHS